VRQDSSKGGGKGSTPFVGKRAAALRKRIDSRDASLIITGHCIYSGSAWSVSNLSAQREKICTPALLCEPLWGPSDFSSDELAPVSSFVLPRLAGPTRFCILPGIHPTPHQKTCGFTLNGNPHCT
jgi:hypothetical protein